MIHAPSGRRAGRRPFALPGAGILTRPAIPLLAFLPLLMDVGAALVTFDDVPLDGTYTGPGGGNYYNGASASQGVGDWNGSFQSGGALFTNTFSEFDLGGGATFSTWQGFAVSNTSDRQTSGFENQYSAWPGGPPPGTEGMNYGIGFGPATIRFDRPVSPTRVSLTNTTYAASSMRFGDAFASPFGDNPSTPGVVERDFPSWLLLTVAGSLNGVASSETAELYLADYRFSEDTLDFILDEWSTLDLSSLGLVDELDFAMTSSDTGPFGINTPAYFALDQLHYTPRPIPEIHTFAGVCCFTVLLAITRRRRP